MNFKKYTILLFVLTICTFAYGQKISALKYRNYMAFGYGTGKTRCLSSLPTGQKEEYLCKTKDYLYTVILNPLGNSSKQGFKFGYYFDFTIGLSNSKWYIRRTLNDEKAWQKELGPLMNLNLGFQQGYFFKDKNMLIGVRYFNNYNADVVRSGYGNSDDPATIGLFYTKNSLDADFSYGSDKIPGLLVKSTVWDIVRFNGRYNVPRKNFKDGQMIMCVGLRYEHSILKDEDSFLNLNGKEKANTNSVWITIGARL